MINPMTPQRAAILAVLVRANEPMRPVDIAAMVGKSPSCVCSMLLVMRTDGQAEQVAYGWRATADGVRAYAAHLRSKRQVCRPAENHCGTGVSSLMPGFDGAGRRIFQ